MGTEERFFVRAERGAGEKGPYSRASVEQSYARGLIKPGAILRREGESDAEAVTVKELIDKATEKKELERAKAMSEFRQLDAENHARHERSSGNGQMLLGALMVLLGIGASAATCSVGTHTILFTGLIVGGFVQMVRGAGRRRGESG